MRKECAWCGVFMGMTGSPDPEGGTSHGICEHCLYTKYRPYYDVIKSRGKLPSQLAAQVSAPLSYAGAMA